MRPVRITQVGTGRSQIVVADIYQQPFDMGIGLNVTGTINYDIQYTLDDVANIAPASIVWQKHPTLQGLTANANGSIGFPVTGVTIFVNSAIGGAQVAGSFIQGIGGN